MNPQFIQEDFDDLETFEYTRCQPHTKAKTSLPIYYPFPSSSSNTPATDSDPSLKFKLSYTDIPKTTKVLLVCIFNKNSTIITHDILYRLFNEHGEVIKILIFEKSKLWKAFVEMETLE
jgi:hypothetical protein